MNRDNPLNLRDQEGYRQELELMKQAHKVMVRNVYSQNQRKRQPDVNAEDRYYDFINYNTVKEMIDGYLSPINKLMPQIRKEVVGIEKAF